MKAKITIARNSEKIPKHISEVENGIKCHCTCISCGEPLVAANNGHIQEHHFRHQSETKCDGSPESALHLLAKRIIAESTKIIIDRDNHFEYQSTKTEEPIDDIRPDIQIIGENEKSWLIEIVVTHFIDEIKLKKITSKNLNCLEIDLQDVDRHINLNDLKDIVIKELDVRKVKSRTQEQNLFDSPKSQTNPCVSYIIGGILVFVFGKKLIKMLTKKTKPFNS